MDRKLMMMRVGTVLASGAFAFLLYAQSTMSNRPLAYVVGGLAGVFAGLTIYGFISLGRYGAGDRR